MTISPPTFFLCFLENPGTLPQENWRLVLFFFLYQPGPLLQMEGDNRHPIFLLNPGTQDRGLHCHGNLFFFLRDVTPKCRLCECSTCFFSLQVARRRVENRAGTCATVSLFLYNPGLSRAPMTFCSSSNQNEVPSWRPALPFNCTYNFQVLVKTDHEG